MLLKWQKQTTKGIIFNAPQNTEEGLQYISPVSGRLNADREVFCLLVEQEGRNLNLKREESVCTYKYWGWGKEYKWGEKSSEEYKRGIDTDIQMQQVVALSYKD